ncbi:hypothetical protein GCM10022630_19120 [Thermobifida alba]
MVECVDTGEAEQAQRGETAEQDDERNHGNPLIWTVTRFHPVRKELVNGKIGVGGGTRRE